MRLDRGERSGICLRGSLKGSRQGEKHERYYQHHHFDQGFGMIWRVVISFVMMMKGEKMIVREVVVMRETKGPRQEIRRLITMITSRHPPPA